MLACAAHGPRQPLTPHRSGCASAGLPLTPFAGAAAPLPRGSAHPGARPPSLGSYGQRPALRSGSRRPALPRRMALLRQARARLKARPRPLAEKPEEPATRPGPRSRRRGEAERLRLTPCRLADKEHKEQARRCAPRVSNPAQTRKPNQSKMKRYSVQPDTYLLSRQLDRLLLSWHVW